jgi:hypothetical protein
MRNQAGIYILEKNQKLCQNKIQNEETLPKLDIGIYSKFGQYYRYDRYHTVFNPYFELNFQKDAGKWYFLNFSFGMWLRLHSYSNLL